MSPAFWTGPLSTPLGTELVLQHFCVFHCPEWSLFAVGVCLGIWGGVEKEGTEHGGKEVWNNYVMFLDPFLYLEEYCILTLGQIASGSPLPNLIDTSGIE